MALKYYQGVIIITVCLMMEVGGWKVKHSKNILQTPTGSTDKNPQTAETFSRATRDTALHPQKTSASINKELFFAAHEIPPYNNIKMMLREQIPQKIHREDSYNGTLIREKEEPTGVSFHDGVNAVYSAAKKKSSLRKWANRSIFQKRIRSTDPNLQDIPIIQYSSLTGPAFVKEGMVDHFTAAAGTTAVLLCRVSNLHNYTVSWIRGADIRLLTTGTGTYATDTRFAPSNNPSGSKDWLLKIHYSRPSDSGQYICQVSLSPPISRAVYLNVYEAEVHISPGKEVHVQEGSALNLQCTIQGCPHADAYWTRNGQKVPFILLNDTQVTSNSTAVQAGESEDAKPDRYREQDVTSTADDHSAPVTIAKLTRLNVTPSASGLYICASTCTMPANVTVHVLRGEELAAIHLQNTSAPFSPSLLLFLCLICVSTSAQFIPFLSNQNLFPKELYRAREHSVTWNSGIHGRRTDQSFPIGQLMRDFEVLLRYNIVVVFDSQFIVSQMIRIRRNFSEVHLLSIVKLQALSVHCNVVVESLSSLTVSS